MKARNVVIAVAGCAVAVALIARVFVGCAEEKKAVYQSSEMGPYQRFSAQPTTDVPGSLAPTLQAQPVPTSPSPSGAPDFSNAPDFGLSTSSSKTADSAATTPSPHLQQFQLGGANTFTGNAAAAQAQPNGGSGSGASEKKSMLPIDQYDTVMVPTSNGEPATQPQAASGDRPTELWIVEKQGKAYSGPAGGSGGAGGLIVGPNSADPSLKNPEPQIAQQQRQDRLPIPGSGAMFIQGHDGQQMVPVPLDHTDVNAKIQGYIASVHVLQHYHNPFSEKIEAVYVFPLPQDAAVSEFVMTIGDRHIRGIIREKAEAQRIYNEARAQGYVASLLTQDRPNIFTQKVANIEPNKKVDVDITYFNTMSYVDGSYEFVFPMVVGPRFNPPGFTDGVGAVERGAHGISNQKTEVQYLRPDERSGHDIALSVDVNAGVPIEQLDSANHKINVTHPSPSETVVSLDPADSIPNKDFVLRYKVAGGRVKAGMFVQRDATGGYFTMMLFPPDSLRELPRQPMEMVFTVDVSGSQSGAPLAQEKAATRYCLTHMGSEDTFQVVRFGDTARTIFPRPMPADDSHVNEALQWVDSFDATEGTMLVDGVHASLNFPHDESRLRFVAFMTDGFIGNEAEALSEIHKCLGPARIFSFGVGSSTNRYLLDHMAAMGNGVAAYLGLNDDANQVMAAYFQRISHPALTNITVDWNGMDASEVFPERIGDLFVGRPVVLNGRFKGPTPKQIVVHGTVGGHAEEFDIPIDAETVESGPTQALASVWARTKVAELSDRATWEPNQELPGQIRQISLDYGLVSDYTSFVAVDSLTKTEGDHGTTVFVPVPVPDGVRYETTVQGSAPGGARE